MPQQIEERHLAGGIDTDSATSYIEDGSLLNAENVRALKKDSQSAGELEYIKGNIEVEVLKAVLPAGTNTLLGKCVDDNRSCIYLLFHNGTDSSICEYDVANDSARIILSDSLVTGGFGWAATDYIPCDVSGDLLAFADSSGIRYVHLATSYSTTAGSQLSLITEPGAIPPVATRVSVPGAASTIQKTPLQFAYRLTNTDGFYSVLSPYSLTSLPARESEIVSLASSGNAIDVNIPLAQKIPGNWDLVDMVVRYMDTNVFYTIRSWHKGNTADDTAVANHNAGSAALKVDDWTGATLEALGPKYVAKQNDAVPRTARALKFAASRLFLGGVILGYDTPVLKPTITVNQDTFNPSVPTSTARQAYLLVIHEDATNFWHFAIILRFNSKNYLLPRETATGRFVLESLNLFGGIGATVPITNGLFQLPSRVSLDKLTELKETGDPDIGTPGPAPTGAIELIRQNIVVEANGLTSFVPQTTGVSNENWYLTEYQDPALNPITVEVEVVPSEFGPGAERRAFVPVEYGYGIQYFDGPMRKSGRLDLGAFTPAAYTVTSPALTERIEIIMPGGTQASIPSWAEYFAITMSKASRASRFGFFFGGIVKAAFKNSAGEISYRDPADLTSPPAGFTIYGIAVPIPATFNYEYVAGDSMRYSIGSSSGAANVIAAVNGHFIIEFTNDGTMHTLCDGFDRQLRIDSFESNLVTASRRQAKTAFILLSGLETSVNQYEVASTFGVINTAGANKSFGNFFDTGTTTAYVLGDAHTVKRTSDAGGGTGISMSPTDSNTVWVNDLGRIAPLDTVGEKDLYNQISWSNTAIPGASTNGYASFDANDYKTTDAQAGPITALALTTKDIQDGGQLLILCEHGSFAALIGQQTFRGADGKTAFTATVEVIGELTALRGGYGCLSPRSVVAHEGKVWWVDAYNRKVVEFNDSGAGAISNFKAARLWEMILKNIPAADYKYITAGVNPFTTELMVSVPTFEYVKPDLVTVTGLANPLDAVNGVIGTWIYNWEANRWICSYSSGAEFVRVSNRVFGWLGGLWEEFIGDPGTYYDDEHDAMAVVPFSNPEVVKSPHALHLDGGKMPDVTWIVAGMDNDAVTSIQPYKIREGVGMAPILRNRRSGAANSPTTYQAQMLKGPRLKNHTIIAVLIYHPTDSAVALSSAALVFDASSGH